MVRSSSRPSAMPGSSSTTKMFAIRLLHHRQQYSKDAAFSQFALDGDFAAMRLDDLARHGQSNAGSLNGGGFRSRSAHELAEDLLLLAGRDADAVVAHTDHDPFAGAREIHPNRARIG